MDPHQHQHMTDSSTWPSRYYGRTRHVDLERIYTDLLARSTQQQDGEEKTNTRRVRISTEEPTVYEYEPEYDADDSNRPSPCYTPIDPNLVALVMLQDEEDVNMTKVVYRPSTTSVGQARSLKRLDLRPVHNPRYQQRTAPADGTSDDDSGSVSSAEPATPEEPFPEPSWSKSVATPPPPAPLSRKIDLVRQSISRIRPTSWIAKKTTPKILYHRP